METWDLTWVIHYLLSCLRIVSGPEGRRAFPAAGFMPET